MNDRWKLPRAASGFFLSGRRLIGCGLAAFLALVGTGLLWAQPEEILLDHDVQFFYNKNMPQKLRSATVFPHQLHLEAYDCLECHHDYRDGRNVLDEDELEEGNPDILCSACHDSQSNIDLKDAFHQQCVGCHIESRPRYFISGRGIQWKSILSPGSSGPRCCGECHLRQPPLDMPWE